MRIFIPVILTTLLLLPGITIAQTALPSTSWQADNPQAHAEAVLDHMVNGKMDLAFKELFKRGKYSKDKLEKLQFEFYRIVKKYGNPYAFERIVTQTAGTSVVRLRYLLLFKTLPMSFDFYYYKAADSTWLLKTYSVSTEVKKIFEQ